MIKWLKLPDFLLINEAFINFSKRDIDNGNTPQEIYSICSCIRTTFCISYGIKKNNNLYLYFQKENVLIKFKGQKLRYLGPDERNQALLLKKAFNKIDHRSINKNNSWIESTPGIYVMKLSNISSFLSFLKKYKNISFISNYFSPFDVNFLYHYFDVPKIIHFRRLKNLKEQFFIIPSNKTIIINILREIVQSHPSMLEYIIIANLNKIKMMSDKILFINFQIDQMSTEQ